MWITPLLSKKMFAMNFIVDLVALNFFVSRDVAYFTSIFFLFALQILMIQPGFIRGYISKMKSSGLVLY